MGPMIGPATDRQINYLDALSRDMVTNAQKIKDLNLEGAAEFTEAAAAVVNALAVHAEAGILTKANASQAIDHIVSSNRTMAKVINEARAAAVKIKPAVSTSPSGELKAGMYRQGGGLFGDGDIVRIYLGQQSGIMLAKKVVKDGRVIDPDLPKDDPKRYGYTYEYMGAAWKYSEGLIPMSLDEAKKWGQLTRSCCVCARRLDVPESVDAGIGPKCAKKFS